MNQDYKETYIRNTHCIAYRDGRLRIQHPRTGIYRLASLNKPHKVNGYPICHINGKEYKQHRVIYKCFNPEFDIDNSKLFIDHVDRDRANNSIVNLRLVTRSQNVHNSGPYSHNKSGHKGIHAYYISKDKYWVWRIQIRINGKLVKKESKIIPQPDISPDEDFDYEKYPVPDHIIQLCRELREKLHGEYACHGSETSKPKRQFKLTIKKPLHY